MKCLQPWECKSREDCQVVGYCLDGYQAKQRVIAAPEPMVEIAERICRATPRSS